MKKLLQRLCISSIIAGGFLVAEKADAQIVTIGTGTTPSSSFLPSPVSVGGSIANNNKSSRHQVLYTKAQLNAAGITGPKLIDSLAWIVSTAPSTAIINYSIKGRMHTPNIVTQFENSGFTQLVLKPTYQPAVGVSWLPFSTPLYWNGVDNLMFDICSDPVSIATSGRLYVTSTTLPQWGYSGTPASSCGYNGNMAQMDVSGGSSGAVLPNIRLSFRAAPACTGVPSSLSITPNGTITNCVMQTQMLWVSNAPNADGTYQWQQSINGGAWQNVAVGTTPETSGTGVGYLATYVPSISSGKYRVVLTCGADSVTSNEANLVPTFLPIFAALPYKQDFENWINECGTTDAPDSSWVNTNATGLLSWRREDQGASAGWTDLIPYNYSPVSSSGSHSARIQTSKKAGTGSLLLFTNMAGPGLKELRFDYLLKTTGTGNFLKVYYSQDGGATYTFLSTYGNGGVNAAWQPQVLSIPSTSATTVIKFEATGTGGSVGDFDMGIDNVRVFPTCADAPFAGTVDSNSACLGTGLNLSLNGTTSAGGLTWLWQESDGISWDTIPGGNIEHPSVVMNGPKWYRCIVTCTNSGLSDISAPRLLSPLPFYNCYCASLSTIASPGLNIGNVKLFQNPNGAYLINAGNPTPTFNNINANQHYTNRTNLPPADIYTDSSYRLRLTFITMQGPPNNNSMPAGTSKVYIDWNQNGAFEASEKVMSHYKAGALANITDSALITVPSNAPVGITAMRIITNNSSTDTSETTWGPCNAYGKGETEDYLVRVWQQACNGGSVAGDITISDTLSCPDYPFTLTNSNYDISTALLTRTWQQSTDGITYTDIPGSQNQPVLVQHFTTDMWYRIQSICAQGGAPTTSNAVKINKNVACYCASYADGGFAGMQDSSDVGGFSFSTIDFPLLAGHLNNPDAVNGYTNHTLMTPTVLWADSTYNFTIDHTLLRNDHADAKVTMFLDYNANGVYDIPQERIFSDTSTLAEWQLSGFIVIPSNVTVNVPTGLRVIINNNIAPNVPSDEACGVYTSGETEDYVVMFKKVIPPPPPIGIATIGNLIQYIHIFPNPATGIVSIQYKGANLKGAIVKVQNLTGAILENKHIGNLKEGEEVKVNLGQYAKGIYFISLESEGSRATGKVVLQ